MKKWSHLLKKDEPHKELVLEKSRMVLHNTGRQN